jgi:hypothetical protein
MFLKAHGHGPYMGPFFLYVNALISIVELASNMKIRGLQIITTLIKVSAIIALTTIDEEEWVARNPNNENEFKHIKIKWDCVEHAGRNINLLGAYQGISGNPLLITNRPNEKTFSLTNQGSSGCTYTLHDESRVGKPWLKKTIQPDDTHSFTVVGEKFYIILEVRTSDLFA